MRNETLNTVHVRWLTTYEHFAMTVLALPRILNQLESGCQIKMVCFTFWPIINWIFCELVNKTYSLAGQNTTS